MAPVRNGIPARLKWRRRRFMDRPHGNGGNRALYGGGGGGSYGSGTDGSGAQGIVVITYTPAI